MVYENITDKPLVISNVEMIETYGEALVVQPSQRFITKDDEYYQHMVPEILKPIGAVSENDLKEKQKIIKIELDKKKESEKLQQQIDDTNQRIQQDLENKAANALMKSLDKIDLSKPGPITYVIYRNKGSELTIEAKNGVTLSPNQLMVSQFVFYYLKYVAVGAPYGLDLIDVVTTTSLPLKNDPFVMSEGFDDIAALKKQLETKTVFYDENTIKEMIAEDMRSTMRSTMRNIGIKSKMLQQQTGIIISVEKETKKTYKCVYCSDTGKIINNNSDILPCPMCGAANKDQPSNLGQLGQRKLDI